MYKNIVLASLAAGQYQKVRFINVHCSLKLLSKNIKNELTIDSNIELLFKGQKNNRKVEKNNELYLI